MKFRWMTGILMAGALAISAMAQANHAQDPRIGGLTATEPSDDSDDSAVSPGSKVQPQDMLNAYEKQMAAVTVHAYTELTQIAQAVREGQISNDQAEHLTNRCFEVTMIRLQFLDTLHQIMENALAKEGPPANAEESSSVNTTSEGTLVVAPPISSPDIPESVAKYLELTPAQIAAIQARITQEQKEVQPLLQHLSENRKALTMAAHTKSFNNSHIRRLALEQGRIVKQLTLANSRLEREIYQILTVEQRQKLQAVETTPDVAQGPFAQR